MNSKKKHIDKPKVLILCQYFYPEYISSATLPTQLAEDLVKNGLNTHVLCGIPFEYYNGKRTPKYELYNGIHIKRMRYTKLHRNISLSRIINYISFTFSAFFHIFEIAHYNCIIVYSNPPILPIVAAFGHFLFKTPIIYVTYDIYPDLAVLFGQIKKNGIIEKIINIFNIFIYHNVTRIIVLGQEMAEYLKNNKKIIDKTKIYNIPNWFERIIPAKEKTIKSYNNKDNLKREFLILYSGNMGICQDLETIKNAIMLLRDREDIMFVFTGHGSKVNNLKKWKINNKLSNVEISGFIMNQDYIDLLKSADCCLVSLEKGVEGLSVPSKTYGYLAAGKPVIAVISNKTELAKDLYEYSAGISILQNDSINLAKSIVELANNKNKTLKMGENARRLFEEKYERSICTQKYYKLIQEIIYGDNL